MVFIDYFFLSNAFDAMHFRRLTSQFGCALTPIVPD